MKLRFPLLVTLVVSALFISVRVAAQAQPAAPAPASPPAPTPPPPVVAFNAAFARITEKASKGPVSSDDIEPELREMESILAGYAGKKAEEAASLYLILARVYVELLEDYPRGVAILKQVKVDYPKIYAQAQVGKILDATEERMMNDSVLYIGKVFPTFAEKDVNGHAVSTAKLKGKVVLVSFWASWSGQCVTDLDTQAAAYAKYHAKGFEIIGISVDEERNDLKALLAKKNLPWPQYCDGKGWKGRVVRQYGVSGVPFSVLLDGEGRIIAKNLRGEALEKKLAKQFGG